MTYAVIAIFFVLEEKMQNTDKRIFKTRKRVILIICALLLFLAYLIVNLFKLQILLNSYYKNKVYDQITTSSSMKADRGNIYDRNMTLLATTKSSWRIFI